jgi:hypothetical protein
MALKYEFDSATRRAERRRKSEPFALTARFQRRGRRVLIRLNTGIEIAFSPADVEGLERADPEQLEPIEISPSGQGLHFPKLDADVYIPALLEGVLGSRKWMAARLGASGGQSRSAAKIEAARANGRLGGRPRRIGVK